LGGTREKRKKREGALTEWEMVYIFGHGHCDIEDERRTSRPGCFGRGAERSKAVSDIYFYC
jgi:hypothetical protein